MAGKEKSILTSRQKIFLELIAQEKYFAQKFYLTGGTALSEFYLKHRMSEDLDFFSETEVNPIRIASFLKEKKEILELEKYDTRQILGLCIFFLCFNNKENLKVDFSYYPFPRIERGLKYRGFDVDSLYDIAVNKVHTISMKARARDFIDIYFIVKEKGYEFKKLLLDAKAKFDWDITALELGSHLIQASKMSDYPRMLKPIRHKEWKEFFLNEGRKLKNEIFKP